jgi:hypothetical protein
LDFLSFSKQMDSHLLSLDEQFLGTTVGFIKRAARKLSPMIFLKALCFVCSENITTYTQIALMVSILKHSTVSKQAVAKRIGKPMVDFCKHTLAALLSKQILPINSIPLFTPFNRILVQDSTSLQLSQQFVDQYPGPRNRFLIQYATAKIQTVIDLKQNSFLHLQLTPFIKNDQSVSSDILSLLKPGDLIIRDLGYFVLSVFQKIIAKNAFFISRLRHNTVLFDKNFERFNLLEKLSPTMAFDQWIYIGADEKMPARIVAIPLTQQIADSRRRNLLRNRDRRLNPSKTHLDLCSWAIFITNVSEKVWSAEQIKDVYKLRWRIEIVFKAWKSHFKLGLFTSEKNLFITETLIYTRLIYIVVFNTVLIVPILSKSERTNSGLSLLKLSAFITQRISFLVTNNDTVFATKLLDYFCAYEKRKNRKNYFQELMLS